MFAHVLVVLVCFLAMSVFVPFFSPFTLSQVSMLHHQLHEVVQKALEPRRCSNAYSILRSTSLACIVLLFCACCSLRGEPTPPLEVCFCYSQLGGVQMSYLFLSPFLSFFSFMRHLFMAGPSPRCPHDICVAIFFVVHEGVV